MTCCHCRPVNWKQLRPITLVPFFEKLLEKIILGSVKDGIALSEDKDQFAYRKSSSTTCMLIEYVDHVARHLVMKNTLAVGSITFDFSKAFDQVDHGLLLTKLCHICLTTGN